MPSFRWGIVPILALAMAVPHSADAAPHTPVPPVWPVPQEVTPRAGVVTVPRTAVVVVGEGTDTSAVDVVERTLRSAGATTIVHGSAAERRPGALVVFVGGPAENPATASVLEAMQVAGPEGLPRGGYVLAADAGLVALSGVDTAGTFYAAQSLRQVLAGGRTGAFAMRDWPAAPLRGVIEGFYGAPWSHADRLSQLDFYGRTKQNIYVYSPKDDPFLRERWRDEYPPDQLATIKELVDRAAANHVQFTYALSPGLSVCYSSDADAQALIRKFQSLWDIGVRTFAVPLDDISYTTWNWDADAAKFGTGGAAAGIAQAFLLNRVQQDFIATHPGAERLQMVPTEYYDLADSGYKTALRTRLDPAILVEWTGVGVIAPQITEAQARQAKQVFGHDILVWDNYPVNDYLTQRLLMGPYVGRELAVAPVLAGLTANPMVQAEASKIAEFTSADFLWNPSKYDPDKSWAAALADFGGAALPALQVFAENNYAGVLSRLDTGKPDSDSPVLRPLLTSFWTALDGPDPHGAAMKLSHYFTAMAANPANLRHGLAANQAFLDEIGPWLDKLGFYGEAGTHAVRMLLAQHDGDGSTAWSERAAVVAAAAKASAVTVVTASGTQHPSVCADVCAPFIAQALTAADRWFGLPRTAPTPTTSLSPYGDNSPDRMVDGDDATYFWSNRTPLPGDYVGVDLGAVRPLSHVDITMAKPGSDADYIHNGALEYSTDGQHWITAAASTTPVLSADVAAEARYVRLRSTAGQTNWVVVREFSVTTTDATHLTVSGTPASPTLANAADGKAESRYTAAPPSPGDALVVTASTPAPLDKVVILAGTPSADADVQILDGQSWHTIGRLHSSYAEISARGITTDRIRLLWAPGSVPPTVAEVIPWFTTSTPVTLTAEEPALEADAGGTAVTSTVDLSSTVPRDYFGTLTVAPPPGITVTPAHHHILVRRGAQLTLPISFSASRTGTFMIPVTFKPDGAKPVTTTITVTAYPQASATNVALGGEATASCREVPDQFGPELAVDGNPTTRFSSCYDDSAWWQVRLPQPADVTEVVVRWESAYGKSYDLQTSSDGRTWTTVASVRDGDGGTDTLRFAAVSAQYIRLQGVARSSAYGYSLYEVEVHPVS